MGERTLGAPGTGIVPLFIVLTCCSFLLLNIFCSYIRFSLGRLQVSVPAAKKLLQSISALAELRPHDLANYGLRLGVNNIGSNRYQVR
jgi:hypothetical protein